MHSATKQTWRPEDEDLLQQYNDSHAGTGILSATLRNVGILAILCMGGLFLLNSIGDTADSPRTAEKQPIIVTPATSANSGQSTAYLSATSEMQVRANAYGNFVVTGRIDGTKILFLVDTGATKVSLAPQDAERLGLRANQLDFTETFHSANGIVRGAPVVLPHLRIGDIDMYDVEASVQESPMQISLLGMTFLSRLEGYEVKGDRLTLLW